MSNHSSVSELSDDLINAQNPADRMSILSIRTEYPNVNLNWETYKNSMEPNPTERWHL